MQYTVIDVREPVEYQSGHVKNSINIPLDQIRQGAQRLSNVPKDSNIIVYCRSGNRSFNAINILKSLGYTNITNGINKEHIDAEFGIN